MNAQSLDFMPKECNRPKSNIVTDYIVERLRSGQYPVGSRFISENQLALELGISKNTIREAISSLVSGGVFSRVRGSGTYVQSIPGEIQAKQAALLVGNPLRQGLQDVFIGSLLAGLHDRLDDQGWRIRLKAFEPLDRASEAVDAYLADGEGDGVVVLAGFTFAKAITDKLLAAGRRVVGVGRPEADDVPFVHTDHAAGMRLALDHLFKAGHRRIALVDRRTSHAVSHDERQEAYMKTLAAAGVVPDARLMLTNEGYDMAAGERAEAILSGRNVPFTAAVVYGDWATHGFRRGLERRGLSVPGDVSLVCYGAELDGMTSISSRFVDMAREAGALILDPSAGLPGKLMAPTLINSAGSVAVPAPLLAAI